MAVSDNFNRADENPLNPANWDVPTVAGGHQVVSNLCAASSNPTASRHDSAWKTQTFGPDCYSQITVTTRPASGFEVGLLVRSSNTTDSTTRSGYRMQWIRGGNCIIFRENGDNTVTTLGTAVGPTFNDGDIVRFQVVGSALTVIRNVTVTVVTASDSTYGAAGYVGIGCSNTGGGANACRLDDFLADTTGALVGQTVTNVLGRGNAW